jgi:Flp pilus assembly protein TadD
MKPKAQHILAECVASILLAAVFLGGCSRERGKSEAPGDEAAFQQAVAMEQREARVQALEEFLESYPKSSLRAQAYRRLYDDLQKVDEERAHRLLEVGLAKETDPSVRSILLYKNYQHARDSHPQSIAEAVRKILKEEPKDAGIYNAVAWNLVERGEHLDLAVELARKGAELAEDRRTKGYILDTEGWALFKQGRFSEAVEKLEEALGYYGEPDEEILEHLARAHAMGGDKDKALEIFTDLLVSQEDPGMRAEAEALLKARGGDLEAFREEIRRRRLEAARAAPDFTLKDLEGKEISLSDFRGKVVLLNFWHPT